MDVESIIEHAKTLPGVAYAQSAGHGCSRQSMSAIREAIGEHKLNRVVIGGCSPRTHLAKFQDLLQQSGLNKYLVEIANLRDQNTWVHAHQADKALLKAKEMIAMAAASVTRAQPLSDHSLPINKNVLVVGGGVTGMTSALELAEQGFKVYLAEKSPELGGVAIHLQRTLEGDNVQEFLADLIARTRAETNIEVITSALIVDHSGMPGMFKTGMQVGKQMFYRQIEHGVTIMATGAQPNRPNQYLLDSCEQVMTQLELQNLAAAEPETVKAFENVVMIQCVGSRTEENPNCSRICCQTAIKNALKILEINPEARIFVLYRDMRTYGFQEKYYQKAREKGVIFVRYSTDSPPEVTANSGKVDVSFIDPIIGQKLSVSSDCVVLSTGLVADTDSTEEVSMIFKLPLTHDKYLLEDHIKLRPVDLPVPGFFVAGTAHGPKTIKESLTQARAVASRAMTLLAKDSINMGAAVARVNGDVCAACLICVRACPFDVPFINADGYSEIDPAKCHGCGICASECPAKAIQLMQFEDDQILATLEELFERTVA